MYVGAYHHSHPMEETEAGLKILYIRETTFKYDFIYNQNNYIAILRFPMPWRPAW